jgi:serine/threonine protein kinase
MPLTTGTRLGPYEIVSQAGAGGMGEVYRARDTRLDRTVAIKLLPDQVSADREIRERFEREARTVAALNHPNIDVMPDGEHFLVNVSSQQAALTAGQVTPITVGLNWLAGRPARPQTGERIG